MVHQDESLELAFRILNLRRQYRYWRRLAYVMTFLAGLEAGLLLFVLSR